MISAIILAAGESKRMGQPKMLLPWGADTVIKHVISVFQAAGIEDILVVIGGAREQVQSQLEGLAQVRTVFNPDYKQEEMLGSLQLGLAGLGPETRAALICLGDQPQVQQGTVRMVCSVFREKGSLLVVPSYHMRRGHPWLIARPLWRSLSELSASHTARDFLNMHTSEIEYVDTYTPTVIEDLDTPRDYQEYNPGEL
jgi:molybdenum cofactor cytidylyltransferase